jgi:hypothetical protein
MEPDQRIFYTSEEEPGVWVWVHSAQPDLDSLIHTFWAEKFGKIHSARELDW